MLFARAVQSTAVMVLVTAATIVSAATANADVDLAEQYAQQAQAAADAADQAFVDADWDEVRAQAGAFEAAYAKLLAHRGQLATDVSDRQSAVTSAQLALDEAQIELDFALGSVATAQGSLTQAIAARDEALAALDRARAAVEAALLALVGVPKTIQQCMEDGSGGQRCIELPNVRYQELMGAAEDAQTVADSAANHVTSRQAAVNDELDKLRTQMAQYNVDFWEVAVAEARAALDDARAAVGNTEDLVDQADALIDGLEDAVQSVADRRADLVDLDTVKRTVVWTLGVDNETPRAGDTVTLNFAIPNSQLFALSSAQVTVTTPLGVVPTCDIVDGVVAAGAVVHCSATYVPTDADAAAGRVTFEVELTGYIPLGPGNPRAKAATQTRIAASTSIVVPVAAGDEDAGSDDSADGDDDAETAETAETAELAETGLGSAGAAGIAVALMLGGALLIVGRERTLPRP